MSHLVVVRYFGGDDACVYVCGHCACRARARQANQVGALARTQIKWVTRRFRGKNCILYAADGFICFIIRAYTKVHDHFYQHRARSESNSVTRTVKNSNIYNRNYCARAHLKAFAF